MLKNLSFKFCQISGEVVETMDGFKMENLILLIRLSTWQRFPSHFTLPSLSLSLSLTISYIHTLWLIFLHRTHWICFETSRLLYTTVKITVSSRLHKQYSQEHRVCWWIMQRNVGKRTCVISGFGSDINEILLFVLDWWPLEMGPKRCTETSVTKYVMCPAVEHRTKGM